MGKEMESFEEDLETASVSRFWENKSKTKNDTE